MFRLYKTIRGLVAEQSQQYFLLQETDWDVLLNQKQLFSYLAKSLQNAQLISQAEFQSMSLMAPIGQQEVWAAGVTYFRSRTARMEESKEAGADNFYDRVYEAERPEIFFKSTAQRVVGPGGQVRIRRDSKWNVPEPELTLIINAQAEIIGYSIGNDMSSRDIEGENPLYLPQAKTYQASAAIGPCVLITESPIASTTAIHLQIRRGNEIVFEGTTRIDQMKRRHTELVEYLYRECDFPQACYLMTGTGIVPPDDFSLVVGDRITISIDGIGQLENEVTMKSQSLQ